MRFILTRLSAGLTALSSILAKVGIADAFADKMRASDIADDIIVAATNWENDGRLKHPRNDNIIDFDHGNTLIQSGTAQYSAEVVVGITDSGDALFYDVVDMQPTTFEIKKEESPAAATTQNAIGDIDVPETSYRSYYEEETRKGVAVKYIPKSIPE